MIIILYLMNKLFEFIFMRNLVCIIGLLITLDLVAAPSIIPAPPTIDASSYLVMDYTSGAIIVENNTDERLPPASLTKIMTIYVVASELKEGGLRLEDEVLVSEKAWRTQGSRMFIEVGKRVTVDNLLNGVIIQSGNDASVALAEHVSGTEDVFADLMNKHAEKLGMTNTHFTNSTGLPDDNHYTTAKDLAILSRAYISNFPEIYSRNSIKEFKFNNIKQKNRNKLLWRDSSVDGIKTGHTDAAGYCLVASAVRDDMRLISVVMGASGTNARTKASQALLNYTYRFYESHQLYGTNEVVITVPIWKAEQKEIKLGTNEQIILTIPRGQYEKLEPAVDIPIDIIAPVKQGDKFGTLNIQLNDKVLATVPLIALENIDEGGFFTRMKDKVRLLIK